MPGMTQTISAFGQPGNTIGVAVAGAVNAGDVVVQGKIVGVSRTTVGAAGGTVQVIIEGVVAVAKGTSLAVTEGDPLHYDTSTKVIDAAGTVLMGYAIESVPASAGVVHVKLIPSAS